jgi:hypothetical protein
MEASTIDDKTTDSRPRRESRHRELWGWLFPLGCAIVVVLSLHPSLLFSNTTTAGGDTGAHFIVPYFAKTQLFAHFELTGWTSIWYGGFPLFTFYFPLPALLVAGVSLVIPYDIAFKLITVSGSLALPFALYYLGRCAKLRQPYPIVLSLAGFAYLYDLTYTIDGGNLASTLAGEYAFSISLAFGIWFLAIVVKGLDTPRRIAGAALLYGLCAFSHLLPAFFVAALALVYVLTGRRVKEVVRLGIVGLLGILMIALWVVPFLWNVGYTTSMGWTKVTTYVQSLAPDPLRPWIYLALLGVVISVMKRRRFGLTFAIAGVVSAVAFVVFPQGAVYNARMLPFYVISVYVLAGVAVAEIALWAPRLSELVRQSLSELRDDEGDPFSVDQLSEASARGLTDSKADLLESYLKDQEGAGDGPGEDVWLASQRASFGPSPLRSHHARRDRFERQSTLIGVVTFLLIVVVGVLPPLVSLPSWLASHVTPSFVPEWAAWNYSGYEAKPGWLEYQRLMSTMSSVGKSDGCGRAMWEYNSNQNNFGTPMALMLLPYWTNSCIDSMEGLFFESSATTPYHFLNQSELSASPSEAMAGLPYAGLNVPLGVRHLQLLGVRYYMAFTPEVKAAASQDHSLKLIRVVPAVDPGATGSVLGESWNIYRVLGSRLVTPLKHTPVVWHGLKGGSSQWLTYATAWYQSPSSWTVFRAQNGPASWRRTVPGASVPQGKNLPSVKVTKIDQTNSTLSFSVSKVGVPTLVKISYFPNWHATGAQGPYRVAPNEMVVVPTSHHVVLSYGTTTLDNVTTVVSVIAFLGLLAVLIDPRRMRRIIGRV